MGVLGTGLVLTGTLDGLSRAFRLGSDDFLDCLRGLVRARRLAVVTHPDSRLTVRLERRTGEERRRLIEGAWPL